MPADRCRHGWERRQNAAGERFTRGDGASGREMESLRRREEDEEMGKNLLCCLELVELLFVVQLFLCTWGGGRLVQLSVCGVSCLSKTKFPQGRQWPSIYLSLSHCLLTPPEKGPQAATWPSDCTLWSVESRKHTVSLLSSFGFDPFTTHLCLSFFCLWAGPVLVQLEV